jgi:spore germination protein
MSITFQMAVPSQLRGATAGQVGGEQAFMNWTSEGNTIFEVIRGMATRTNRALYFEHLSVLIIGENVAKSGDLEKIINLFVRDHEMRRRVAILVAKGSAANVLEITPPHESLPAHYLMELIENHEKTLQIPKKMTLGDLAGKVSGKSSYLVSSVVGDEKESKIAGALFFKGNRTRWSGGWDKKRPREPTG